MTILKQDRYSDVKVELVLSPHGIIYEISRDNELLLTAPAKDAWLWLYDSGQENKIPKTFLVEFAKTIIRGEV
jgi:hypothetical protein